MFILGLKAIVVSNKNALHIPNYWRHPWKHSPYTSRLRNTAAYS